MDLKIIYTGRWQNNSVLSGEISVLGQAILQIDDDVLFFRYLYYYFLYENNSQEILAILRLREKINFNGELLSIFLPIFREYIKKNGCFFDSTRKFINYFSENQKDKIFKNVLDSVCEMIINNRIDDFTKLSKNGSYNEQLLRLEIGFCILDSISNKRLVNWILAQNIQLLEVGSLNGQEIYMPTNIIRTVLLSISRINPLTSLNIIKELYFSHRLSTADSQRLVIESEILGNLDQEIDAQQKIHRNEILNGFKAGAEYLHFSFVLDYVINMGNLDLALRNLDLFIKRFIENIEDLKRLLIEIAISNDSERLLIEFENAVSNYYNQYQYNTFVKRGYFRNLRVFIDGVRIIDEERRRRDMNSDI